MKLAAEWTDDCSGKRDYDGVILSIDTRYWPKGGGFFILANGPLGAVIQEGAAGIPPSAHSSLIIRHGDPEDADDLTLTERNFDGETFEEVAAQVEVWAQEQMDRAVAALRDAFR